MSAKNDLSYIILKLGDCKRCKLAVAREKIVFGEGNPNADCMIVGEAPGYHEDLQGKPFVGRAGALLNKMLRVMALTREDVYITNIVKCRPPDNRDPMPEEIDPCLPFLHAQIHAITPKLILAFGRYAANTVANILGFDPISDLIHKDLRYRHKRTKANIPIQAIYHPAFLLRRLERGDTAPFKLSLELMRKAASHLEEVS